MHQAGSGLFTSKHVCDNDDLLSQFQGKAEMQQMQCYWIVDVKNEMR